MRNRGKVLLLLWSVLAIALAGSIFFIFGQSMNQSRSIALIDPAQADASSEGGKKLGPTELPTTSFKYKTQFLTVRGRTIHFTNAGMKKAQGVINKHPNTEAATWGGAQTLSVVDKKNTHLIAHNPGAFSMLTKCKKGEKITVVDNKKKKRVYKIRTITKVDDDAYELKTHKDMWNTIVGTGGGERITLQTCLSKTVNLIIVAY